MSLSQAFGVFAAFGWCQEIQAAAESAAKANGHTHRGMSVGGTSHARRATDAPIIAKPMKSAFMGEAVSGTLWMGVYALRMERDAGLDSIGQERYRL